MFIVLPLCSSILHLDVHSIEHAPADIALVQCLIFNVDTS
jgi:hypothetical protein